MSRPIGVGVFSPVYSDTEGKKRGVRDNQTLKPPPSSPETPRGRQVHEAKSPMTAASMRKPL